MNHLDLFSGIGGFSLGLQSLGITQTYFSEVDKHASAIYKHQFPSSTALGDVRDINSRELPNIDLITFGSPCQDFSVAGKRAGIDGERSGLIKSAIKLIRQCRPRVFIWENVKGAFSTNAGADFAAILQEFANIGGYRLEWQLLNTRWLLPQNRARIYLVGHLADRSQRAVFPITEKDTGLTQRQSNTTSVRCLTAGGNSGGLHSGMTLVRSFEQKNHLVCPVLTPDRLDKRQNGRRIKEHNEPVHTITAQDRHGVLIKSAGTLRKFKDREGYRKVKGCVSPTLNTRAREDGNMQPVVKLDDYKIRRLTEIECERLQGFPDNWTQYGNYDGVIKEVSATQRYKCLGNAVTVKIVELIAKKLTHETRQTHPVATLD